jgi:hypothetical protein
LVGGGLVGLRWFFSSTDVGFWFYGVRLRGLEV